MDITSASDEEVARMLEIMSGELRAAARLEHIRIEKNAADRIVRRLAEERMWTR